MNARLFIGFPLSSESSVAARPPHDCLTESCLPPDLDTDAYRALETQERGGHADEIETSIHLFLQPDLVRMDRAVTDYGPPAKDYPGYAPGLFTRDRRDPAFSETGVYGDPKRATAEKGKQALAILTAHWLKALCGFSEAPRGAGLR